MSESTAFVSSAPSTLDYVYFPDKYGKAENMYHRQNREKVSLDYFNITSISFYTVKIVEKTPEKCVTDIILCSVDSPTSGTIEWNFTEKKFKGDISTLCRVQVDKKKDMYVFLNVRVNGVLDEENKIQGITTRITPVITVKTFNPESGTLEPFENEETSRYVRSHLRGVLEFKFPPLDFDTWISSENVFEAHYYQNFF